MALKTPSNGEELADAIEQHVLISEQSSFGLAEIGRIATGLAPAINVAFAVQQMTWRANVLGAAYPLAISQIAINERADRAKSMPYRSLLSMTVGAKGRSASEDANALTFENVVCEALIAMLGRGSRALRFGWPSDAGRPQEFSRAVAWLGDMMKIRIGSGYRPPRRKDGGVDVVAWRPFVDGRPGFPVILAQCTLESDFVRKARDVDVRLWSTWLGFDLDPMIVLAIPGTLGRTEDWNEIARNCVLLERLRICSLLAADETPIATQTAGLATSNVDHVAQAR